MGKTFVNFVEVHRKRLQKKNYKKKVMRVALLKMQNYEKIVFTQIIPVDLNLLHKFACL